ncbi:MAG: hypothetical protein II975_07760 [Bacteroidales bacterium]|nr:hypothetical protein [Bacteroidales bacterium]MBQ6741802.1 hypothetical protein [Bacteroidales bacterium]
MKQNDAINSLREIKDLMDKSSRFRSISGPSIIIIGVYATLVSAAAWALWGNHESYEWLPSWCDNFSINSPYRTTIAIMASIVVAFISALTVFVMSIAKARRSDPGFSFNVIARRPMLHFMVPAVAGGLLCVALLMQGHYGLTSSMMLVFYGLALVNCHHYTTSKLALLGYCEIVLGIIDCFVVSQAILFWFLGFGLMHIVFGVYLTIKNPRQ